LLNHFNPYTKTTYAQEPAVLVVEVNNENTLVSSWNSLINELPEPYISDLQRRWNNWLSQNYANTSSLRNAWHVDTKPLGEEVFENSLFESCMNSWTFEITNLLLGWLRFLITNQPLQLQDLYTLLRLVAMIIHRLFSYFNLDFPLRRAQRTRLAFGSEVRRRTEK
jgi:hypothetical protein